MMQQRMLYIPILHIDANLINARQKLTEVNQLEQWYEDGVILINMSSTANEEAKAGGNTDRARKAEAQIYTVTEPAASADPIFNEVEKALFPEGAADENQRNDVRIVVEAIKYSAILVTNDGGSKKQPGGILGNREKLNRHIMILSPVEAVEYVRREITKRDDRNKRSVKECGVELPEWTDKD